MPYLDEALRRLKKQHPSLRRLLVGADRHVPYQVLVHTLDTARGKGTARCTGADGCLFDRVVFHACSRAPLQLVDAPWPAYGPGMHMLSMKGAWDRWHGWLYEELIGKAGEAIYARIVAEHIPVPPAEGMIVDVGCGAGRLTWYLAARYNQAQVLGLDLSPEMIARAEERNAALPNLRYREGDALNLPLDTESVDMVVSVGSIKHWPDRALGLAEVLRVLKPGGKLYIAEVERGCSWRKALRYTRLWRLPPGAELATVPYFYSVVASQSLELSDLAGLLPEAGLTNVRVARDDELPYIAGVGTKPLD